MNNLIHCDMCGYLMTKRWSETIDGKTYCRDCVPKKRLIDLWVSRPSSMIPTKRN